MDIFYQKNLIKFKKEIDFNFLTDVLKEHKYRSIFSGPFDSNFILDHSMQIMNVEKNPNFLDIFKTLNKKFNPHNIETDLHIFFSFNSGSQGVPHRDPYAVFLVGAYGKTIYKIEDKDYILEKGDVITIPKYALHKSISITPRIVLSLGTKAY